MDKHVARPIFIVGSPRSGTSILTWALGQHPNILPTEEAPGRGPFAVSVGVYYAVGNRRGARSQLSSLGVGRDEFYAAFGDTIDRLTLEHRTELERLSEAAALDDPAQVSDRFAVSRGAHEPKARWVDGTPELSFYMCGLQRLFPQAKFAHILRDPREVAASMLAFRQDDGNALVETSGQAYDYWLRTTRTCDLAQRALGSQVVYRLPYVDLVAEPERALRGVLDFLGEPWAPACLEPLAQRINSSHVETSMATARIPETVSVVAEALELHARLHDANRTVAPDPAARAQFEAAYESAVDHAKNVDSYHENAKHVLDRIEAVLNEGDGDINEFPRIIAENQSEMGKALAHSRRAVTVCGIVLTVQWVAALVVWISTRAAAAGVALGIATAAGIVYLWLRRHGLNALWQRLSGAGKLSEEGRG